MKIVKSRLAKINKIDKLCVAGLLFYLFLYVWIDVVVGIVDIILGL